MRARSVEELERILRNGEISVEIKIGAGGWEEREGGWREERREREREKTSDSESTQLNALIIVPLHFL